MLKLKNFRSIVSGKYIVKGRLAMEKKKLERINFLAKKKKEEGLTEAELKEQKELYAEYLGEIRKSFTQTLDSIEITD